MSEPAKCPFCGAPKDPPGELPVAPVFTCESTCDGGYQSVHCKDAQITALQAEITRLKAEEEKYWGTAKDWEEAERSAPTAAEFDEIISYQEMKAENQRLRIVLQFQCGESREGIARRLDLPLSAVDAALREHVRTE